MIDLHCHLLPGVDDGSASVEESIAMARAQAADGVTIVACTPHIMPGVYDNDGRAIRLRISELQQTLDAAGVPLHLVVGADVHIAPDLAGGLRSGSVLSLHDTRFVLIEPPHHVMPPRVEDVFFALMTAGYVPVLTHPERLRWIEQHYNVIKQLFSHGVWMQITAGALLGNFGKAPKYWAERMLDEGMVHIMATDAHNMRQRAPNLRAGFEAAAARVGEEEAIELVWGRPYGILENLSTSLIPPPRERGKLARGAPSLWRRVLGRQ